MSPSVRVKRSDYSTLRDRANGPEEPNSGRISIFNWPNRDEPSPVEPPVTSPSRLRASSRVEDLIRTPPLGFLSYGNSGQPVVRSSSREPGILGGSIGSRDGSIPVEIVGDGHHHDDIVDHLDVVDPQVATVSNLTNAANSILIPPLSWYSRKPVVILSAPKTDAEGVSPFEDELDRHVDDLLNNPSKLRIRRILRGVWSFLKTPMGIVTGIYGFLVVFWGAAIVIFLAKIINLHNPDTQGFWVEVSSQVENGLFTVTGIGLIPSRVLDTYRISKIWYYKRRTTKLRKKAGLPQLFDVDDLPDPVYDPNYVHVLTDEEQKDLHRQQVKFQYHQTWYRAHGTETHRAFPINIALLICCLNDGNSIFQIMLCATMWSLNRFQRPAWSTGTLIPASFLCGIISAIFIAYGGKVTKRTEKVEEKLRAVLATEKSQQHLRAEGDRTPSPQPGTCTQNGEKSGGNDELHLRTAIDECMTIPPPK